MWRACFSVGKNPPSSKSLAAKSTLTQVLWPFRPLNWTNTTIRLWRIRELWSKNLCTVLVRSCWTACWSCDLRVPQSFCTYYCKYYRLGWCFWGELWDGDGLGLWLLINSMFEAEDISRHHWKAGKILKGLLIMSRLTGTCPSTFLVKWEVTDTTRKKRSHPLQYSIATTCFLLPSHLLNMCILNLSLLR